MHYNSPSINSPNHNCSGWDETTNQSVFPVGIRMPCSPIFLALAPAGVGRCGTSINHRVSLPDIDMECLRRHKLPSEKEILRMLLGWLNVRRKFAEQRKQIVLEN